MFGRNPLRKAEPGDGLRLEVKEIFGTIQGEGPHAGEPAIFIRLAGCNLACFFCDTAFDNGQVMSVDEILSRVFVERVNRSRARLVVLTGGEPLRQQVGPLVRALVDDGFRVQIETAGTLWPAGFEDVIFDSMGAVDIVCSPKTGSVNPKVVEHCRHWKYLVSVDNIEDNCAFPVKSTQRPDTRMELFVPWGRLDNVTVYYQPMEAYFADGSPDATSTAENIQLAVGLAMRYGHRLCLQQHKIVNLP